MKALRSIRARDLMQREVIALSADTPIEEAVATFEEYHVSGAPVVGPDGALLGFLSRHDIVRSSHVRAGRLDPGHGEYRFAPSEDEDDAGEAWADIEAGEDYSPSVLGSDRVQDWMNPRVISVRPDASLRALCVLMARESIHRVLVVERGKLLGILSTFDIVRHLAEAL